MDSVFLRTICEGLSDKPAFTTNEECFQQGQAAYSQAYSRDQNPYPRGTALREFWDSGYCDEQDELLGA